MHEDMPTSDLTQQALMNFYIQMALIAFTSDMPGVD